MVVLSIRSANGARGTQHVASVAGTRRVRPQGRRSAVWLRPADREQESGQECGVQSNIEPVLARSSRVPHTLLSLGPVVQQNWVLRVAACVEQFLRVTVELAFSRAKCKNANNTQQP